MYCTGKRATSHAICILVKSRIHRTQSLYGNRPTNAFEVVCLYFIKTNPSQISKIVAILSGFLCGRCFCIRYFSQNSCDVCVVLEYGHFESPKYHKHGGDSPMKNYLFFVLAPTYFYGNFLFAFFINIILNIMRLNVPGIFFPNITMLFANCSQGTATYYFHREYVRQMKGQNQYQTENSVSK